MKTRKGLLVLAAVLLFASLIVGCKVNDTSNEVDTTQPAKRTEQTAAAQSPVTLKIYLFGEDGNHYRNVEPVIAEIEKRSKPVLNTTLDIVFTPPADYKQKVPLWIAAGENIDLMFDAPWQNLNKLSQDGAYMDLGPYFNNDEYPGLKKAFPAEFLEKNKFFGKNYAIPITNTFMDMEGVVYRKDLLEKYGMNPISSYDDLYAFLEKVKENEPDMVPYGPYGTSGFFKLFLDPNPRQLEGYTFTFLNYIDVVISPDGKSVKGVAAYGDDEEYDAFDPKWGKDYYMNYFENCKKFGIFLPEDVLASASTTSSKLAAAYYTTLNSYQNEVNKLKTDYPEADLAFWPIYKNNAEMRPNSVATDFKAWNFLVIPTTSTKADRTMKFLDWVYASQDNNDLFVHGIEGVHWEKVGNNQWKLPDGVYAKDNYAWPAYQLGWTPVYQRMPAGLPDYIQKYMDFEFAQNTFKATVIAGFTFNEEPVKTEIARCGPIVSNYMPILQCGLSQDIAADIQKMNSELKAAGVDKIKAELERQLNEFLANK